jgi:hypothetical protein
MDASKVCWPLALGQTTGGLEKHHRSAMHSPENSVVTSPNGIISTPNPENFEVLSARRAVVNAFLEMLGLRQLQQTLKAAKSTSMIYRKVASTNSPQRGVCFALVAQVRGAGRAAQSTLSCGSSGSQGPSRGPRPLRVDDDVKFSDNDSQFELSIHPYTCNNHDSHIKRRDDWREGNEMRAVWFRTSLLTVLAGLFLAAPSFAHHSFAMFDTTKTVTLTGTIKSYQWTNPHVWIDLMVLNPKTKELELWGLEGLSTSLMARRGWSRKSMTAGDKVEIDIHPLKAGGNGGSVIKARVGDTQIGGAEQAQ